MKRWIIAFGISIALLGGTYGAFVLLNQPTPPQTNVQAIQQTVEPITIQSLHEAVNAKRREAGVPELILDDRLNQSAQMKSDDMSTDGYFDHIDPVTGQHGYEYIRSVAQCYGSENLIHNPLSTKVGVDAWMASTEHREVMLSQKYTRVGYGISGEYITQHLC